MHTYEAWPLSVADVKLLKKHYNNTEVSRIGLFYSCSITTLDIRKAKELIPDLTFILKTAPLPKN